MAEPSIPAVVPDVPRNRAPPRDRPIALVGMMGTGKSTVGRRLARLLRLPFVDADTEIERAARMRVAEMFARHGESYFREGERRVIARLLDAGPAVIATGGGAFIQAETRALLLDRARCVWLDADIATLVARVGRRGDRPLLTGRDVTATLTALAEQRRPFYALAPVHVRSDTGNHEEIAIHIARELEQ